MIIKINIKDRTIKAYAFRHLTQTESLRLMGVNDANINLMLSSPMQAEERMKSSGMQNKWKWNKKKDTAISKTQIYKMAGNSIVVDVLTAIYEQLWYPNIYTQKQYSFEDLLFSNDYLAPVMPCKNNEEKIFVTTFSGYDSQIMAAEKLKRKYPDFKYTLRWWSEIDKYVCQAHDLIFPQYADRNLGDITAIDWNKFKEKLNGKDIDLFTYSSPCQDISVAGQHRGIDEKSNSRSSLLWKVESAIKALQPKFLLQENVPALVNNKYKDYFKKWIDILSDLGYISRWKLLNSRDFGVPQNRERLFCLSMRKDVAFDFHFPEPIKLKKHLKNLLEKDVSQSYFLHDGKIAKFLHNNDTERILFLQFNVKPNQDSAFFLKACLDVLINKADGWYASTSCLRDYLEKTKDDFYKQYNLWITDRIFPSDYVKDAYYRYVQQSELYNNEISDNT